MATHVLISKGKDLDVVFPDRQVRCRGIREEARKKGAVILGEYGCRGFNTYGPWKLVGGMNKGHPTREEQDGAVEFFRQLLQRS